ncbi:MAG: lipoyl(octanoyl) transferase LipB [Acidobacteriota bacterium]|nr:lipoyl(octanoyl) transferase LipB [Acidobacteriota bacterium]
MDLLSPSAPTDDDPASEVEPLRPLRWAYLGRYPYAPAVAEQKRLRDAVRQGSGDEHLLLLEHPHVYTLGRNASAEDVLAPAPWLEEQGIEIHEADRGGQVTYHGPGQLMGYPIVNLSPDRRDVRRYVQDLQWVLIRTLADFGVEAEARPGKDLVGVWAGGGKIASIGVHLSRWITTHGFALNVSTDLSFFGGIVACGLPQVRMVSIESLTGERPPLETVAERVASHFCQRFERRLLPLED